ncbi:hypothetical protein [Allomuricauda sp. F6463D]|uniref:hypothetical protein n=1 Tax=Allomuricauda sp. F6463D TaxID=2926409 RepID=UPI001FF5F108|nr:hypothetical protein [Muricauda sp. F6463D]MCK0160543.1 hypothetical protein [Muricauda sp. F6463D]
MKNTILILFPVVFILYMSVQIFNQRQTSSEAIDYTSIKMGLISSSISRDVKSVHKSLEVSRLEEDEFDFGAYPDTLTAYLGTTPKLDGFISKGEYDDAEKIIGVKGWHSDTPPASEKKEDLSVVGWVKHDGRSLYFAFDVTDDIIYGFDTKRWLPSNNPDANNLNIEKGWPFWGDGIELMMNSTYQWEDNSRCVGDGRSWQFCCSTNKSILGGLGVGGLSSGLPLNTEVWERYEKWIRNGDMEASVRLKDKAEGRGYIIEWRINPNPCMKIDETNFVDLSKETKVGFNVEIQDLDEKENGEGNFSNMHHIDYWSKVSTNRKTDLKSFGTLIIKPIKMKVADQH